LKIVERIQSGKKITKEREKYLIDLEKRNGIFEELTLDIFNKR